MSISSSTPQELWSSMVSYAIPPAAASVAIIPAFRGLIMKSFQQKGEPIPRLTRLEVTRAGMQAAPTVGLIVGTQMVVQSKIEQSLVKTLEISTLATIIISSAMVGAISAPILAAFNGQTMKQSVSESLRKLSMKQCSAITLQETAFVAGLSLGDKVAIIMKRYLGDHGVVDYMGTFISGAAGSLAGHPANTALTRWQSGMTVQIYQLMWGAASKAKAVGVFAVCYRFCKEALSRADSPSKS